MTQRAIRPRALSVLLAVVAVLSPVMPQVARAESVGAAVLAPSDPRPDGLVKSKGDRKWAGNDVYNMSGDGQSRTRAIKSGRRAIFLVRAQNDSSATDGIVMTGRAGSGRFRVRYYHDSVNVTDDVVGSGLLLPSLAPGDWGEITIKVKGRGKIGLAMSVWVSASSETTRGIQDVVLATVEIGR